MTNSPIRPAIRTIALLGIVGIATAGFAQESAVPLPISAPNLGRIAANLVVNVTFIRIDARLGYDDSGKIVGVGDVLVDDLPVTAKGKVKRDKFGHWTYVVVLRGDDPKVKVKINGSFGAPDAFISYKGEAGKAKKRLVELEAFPSTSPPVASLSLEPSVSCDGIVGGVATVSTGFAGQEPFEGTVSGKIKGGKLKLKIQAGPTKLVFKSELDGPDFVGQLRVKAKPEKSVRGFALESSRFAVECGGTGRDSTPPVAGIAFPRPGEVLEEVIEAIMVAEDENGIAMVELLVDGESIGISNTEPPYRLEWNTLTHANGSHGLQVRARDLFGNTSVSPEFQVEVVNGPPPVPDFAVGFDELGGSFAHDSSGGLKGAILGAQRSAAGAFGRSMSFSGGEEFVIFDSSPSPETVYTIETWIRVDEPVSQSMTILAKGEYYSLSATPGGVNFTGRFRESRAGLSDGLILPVGAWVHVAVTFDGEYIRLYRNAREVGSRRVVDEPLPESSVLSIGSVKENRIWRRPFRGLIDDIRIYTIPLSRARLDRDRVTPITDGDPPDPLADLHAEIAALPPGHWMSVPASQMVHVTYGNVDNFLGDATDIMAAASGGTLDTRRQRLIVWGGGQSYCGNEIYGFDLSTLTWSRIREPSPFGLGHEGTEHEDGSPVSRHTVDYIEYVPGFDRFFVGSGVAVCPSGNLGSSISYMYDFETDIWTSHGSSPAAGFAKSAVAPDGRVWQHGDSSPDNRLAVFDPEFSTWDSYAVLGPGLSLRTTAEIDPAFNRFVAIGDHQFYVWDLDNPNDPAVALETTGDNEIEGANAPGIAYHPPTGRLVSWRSGRTVYALDLEGANWTSFEGLGADPGQGTIRGIYGRWRYWEEGDVFVTVSSINQRVYFFRMFELE